MSKITRVKMNQLNKIVIMALELMGVCSTKIAKLSFLFFLLEDKCNFRCLYCSSPPKKEGLKELTLKEKTKLISDAKSKGVRTIVFSGHGEPLLNRHFYKVYCYAVNKKLDCIIVTNGSQLTKAMAKSFANDNTQVLFKLESLRPEVHDKICNPQSKFAWTSARHGKKKYKAPSSLCSLLKEFKGKERNITIESVITKINYPDMIKMGRFCKEFGLIFNPKELRIAGNALLNRRALFVSKRSLDRLYSRLQNLYGPNFVNKLKYSRCLMRDNIVIGKYGQAIVCQSVNHVLGSVRTDSIQELHNRALKASKMFPCNITHYKKENPRVT